MKNTQGVLQQCFTYQMFPEHPIQFLISVYPFVIAPTHPCFVPISDLILTCWQRIWLVLTHWIGFHHLPINEAKSTRRGWSVSILYVNGKCDIGSLADCLIAQLIIHGNASPGFDFGGNAFRHAKSDTHHRSASLQKIFDGYLYAPVWRNVVPAPCMSSFGKLPKHLFNKSLEFKYL